MEVRDGVARPDPVWAPFPLTEIAIAVGIVLFGLGYFASADRSHSILLALLPVTAGHTLVAYASRRHGEGRWRCRRRRSRDSQRSPGRR